MIMREASTKPFSLPKDHLSSNLSDLDLTWSAQLLRIRILKVLRFLQRKLLQPIPPSLFLYFTPL